MSLALLHIHLEAALSPCLALALRSACLKLVCLASRPFFSQLAIAKYNVIHACTKHI